MAKKVCRSTLIRAVIAHARKVQGPITLKGLVTAKQVRTADLYRCFPGGLTHLLKAARLTSRIARLNRANSDLLMEDLDRVTTHLGRTPTWMELTRLGQFSTQTYYQRWGKHAHIMAAYEQWKGATKAPPASAKPQDPPPQTPSKPHKDTPRTPKAHGPSAPPAAWLRGEELTGQPLGFRGLMHAPTSESGVIHLFGLLGPELGIAVESIGMQFPDCRALRHLPGSGGKWKRLAIEFELLSSNFKRHGHDPANCDIIVCWQDDWDDCPIEVIELKEEMRKAQGLQRGAA